MPKMRALLVCACLCLPATTPAGSAQAPPQSPDPGGLTKETFFDMETLSGPTISPDGEHVVFTRRWVDQQKDRFASNLWIVNADGTRPRELTAGSWSDSSPLFSPDGERIAFLSDRDGSTQIHVLWLDTREVAQLTRLEKTPSGIAWSPDGRQLAFVMPVDAEEPPLPIKLPAAPKGAERAKAPKVISRASWARDGRGFIEPGYRHIFTLDAVLGGTPKQRTDGDYDHGDPSFSADGRTLLLSGIRKPDAEYLRGDSELYAIDLASGAIETLTDRKGPDAQPLPSPDGKHLAYSGYDDVHFTSHLASLYLLPTSGGRPRLLAGGLPSSPRDVAWSSDSTGLFFTVGERGSRQVWFAPLQGEARRLTAGEHDLSGLSVAESGLAATVVSRPQQPGVLALLDLKRKGKSPGTDFRRLIDVNRDVLEGRVLGEHEELWVESSDGLPVQAWLIKPAEFQPGERYPMLLWIHGGPWSMYDVGFNWAWQNFAAEGYAVLYVNPRGSTGYGQDFVNGIQYDYPGKDYDDLMAAVDAAVAKGFIDERNLFVCGGSGGGVLTAWIVGHTDRFRAAVSMRPVINWHSFVGTTDGIRWYDQFESYPWEDPNDHYRRSPLTYVANVTTPTMVMTGEADLRTPISQSEEYYRALKVLRKETLLVRVPDEFHGWRRPSNQLRQQLYLQAWFEKWRVGAEPEGEKTTGEATAAP